MFLQIKNNQIGLFDIYVLSNQNLKKKFFYKDNYFNIIFTSHVNIFQLRQKLQNFSFFISMQMSENQT